MKETTKLNDYSFLRDIIGTGIPNAIHKADLGTRLQVTQEKAKAIVHQARRNGEEIISGSFGYCYPADDVERQQYYDMMHRQAVSRFASAKTTGEALKVDANQLTLDSIGSTPRDTMEGRDG